MAPNRVITLNIGEMVIELKHAKGGLTMRARGFGEESRTLTWMMQSASAREWIELADVLHHEAVVSLMYGQD